MMLDELVTSGLAHPRAFVLATTLTAALAFALCRQWKRSRKLNLPYLKFEDGNDSRQRYVVESGKLLKLGYEKVELCPLCPPKTEQNLEAYDSKYNRGRYR